MKYNIVKLIYNHYLPELMKNAAKPIEIMIVEDEHVVREYIKGTLEDLGYLVTAAVSTGERALENAREKSPDIVLMDIMLKGELDGVQTAAQLMSQFDIPVIYLTSYADEDTLERVRPTQPAGYVMKPFNEKELRATIEIAVHKHRAERETRQQLLQELQQTSQRISGLTRNLQEPGGVPVSVGQSLPRSQKSSPPPALETGTQEKSYTVKAAAAYLDVSERTIQRMIKEGIFPEPSVTIDIGGNRKLRRWRQQDLDDVRPHLRKRGRPKN